MSKREDYQQRIEDELALWGARFEALKTRAGKDAPPGIKQQLEVWHAGSEAALAKLAELKATTGDKWDAVKVEMETAWHAIEPALNEHVAAARTLTKEEIASLSAEQQDAVLEALVVAVLADGKVGKDEVASFNAEIGKIPWAQPREIIIEKAQAAQARVMAVKDHDQRVAMLKSISGRLPPGPIAEKTFAMMATVMSADKVMGEAEKFTLTAFAMAFGITAERLAAIAKELRS